MPVPVADAMWLPPVVISFGSADAIGYYPEASGGNVDDTAYAEAYASPRASSAHVQALVRPAGGGLTSAIGDGGTGLLPSARFVQANRPAHSHAIVVHTPDVYPNLDVIGVAAQLYDAYGNSEVAAAPIQIVATLPGASPEAMELSAHHTIGTGNTRRYQAQIPPSWFTAAEAGGSEATVRSTLDGANAQLGTFTVHGTPAWFGQRRGAAGVMGLMTADTAGHTAATKMRAGDDFYLQLFAHTGGHSLGSFEARLVVDPNVCTLSAAGGADFDPNYVGDVEGELSGTYSSELLKRFQDPSDGTLYFTKYQRLVRLEGLTSNHGHLGWVRLRMVGSGVCLTSATLTAFYLSGGTTYLPGVEPGAPIIVHGNNVVEHVDLAVGVLAELVTSAPVINTNYLLAKEVSVLVRVLRFQSPDAVTHFTTTDVIAAEQQSGAVSFTVSADGFSHAISYEVVRPSAPALSVEDGVLDALPPECGANRFQRTRLHAISDGVDLVRLLEFDVTDGSVLSVDPSAIPGQAVVRGLGTGEAQVYVRSTQFASTSVRVRSTLVGISALRAGVVTGVTWASVDSARGPFVASPSHIFVSETSRGWLYTHAFFDDGTSQPVEGGVTVLVSSSLNASIYVATSSPPEPPTVGVHPGATSAMGSLEVQTCLGLTSALVNLTLPAPVGVTLTARYSRYSLVPQGNVADEFSGRYAFADLVATVEFADGATRAMQVDSRVTFGIAGACGSFAPIDGYMRLHIDAACRQALVSVTATASIGGVVVTGERTFSVEWLAAVELTLYYKDGHTPFTASQLRYRHSCSGVSYSSQEYHSLRMQTLGTLNSGVTGWIASGAKYATSGADVSGSGAMRALNVASAGAVSVAVSPDPDPDDLSSSLSFTAVAEADPLVFDWSLRLWPLNTLYQPYVSRHATVTTLFYASGPYTETMTDDEKRRLVTFDSSDVQSVNVSDRGWLESLHTSVVPVSVTATFCDGSQAQPSELYSNLKYSTPLDYDLGQAYGKAIAYSPGNSQVPRRARDPFVWPRFASPFLPDQRYPQLIVKRDTARTAGLCADPSLLPARD